jgi:DNA mismatch repair protein MutS2
MNAAYASGVMWIIHGKGTGKLRQGVHDFLMHSPQVKGFELADNSDGGAGVTVTRLS